MKYQLIHGDCFDQKVKADILITDAPFGTTQCKWDAPFDFKAFWDLAEESCAGRVISFAQTPFDKAFGFSNIQNLKYELIWEKTQATGHLNAKKSPMKSHENILVFYPKSMTYNPQKTSGHEKKTSLKRKDITTVYGAQKFESLGYDSTERYPRSVLRYAKDTQRSKLHPTQKPLALMEWLVLTYSNPGDTVLDIFMGSGTTGVACMLHGRSFIGIEKDRKYFNSAQKRIQDAWWDAL